MILAVLKEILAEIEKSNPYRMVIKGGTSLSIYYFNHRDSEDLDFDTDISNLARAEEIKAYIIAILEHLKKNSKITGFRIIKSCFSSTKRYHINMIITTHKDYQTKIDIDFRSNIRETVKKGELLYYSLEHLFISKMLTFISRSDFKDLFDLFFIVKKVDVENFIGNKNVIELIDTFLAKVEAEDISRLSKMTFRNVDLHFRNFKQSDAIPKIKELMQQLKKIRNQIS